MKRVKRIPFFKNIKEIREYQFGTFYFFDGIVISEMNEGVTFEWNMAKKAIKAAQEIFGEDMPIAYISNRINNYHIVPTDWSKFYANRNQLSFYSVVGQTKGSFASLVMERMFFKNSIKQFTDLEEAITWSLSKIEKKQELSN
ncbi:MULTISPECIES: hypothetical protein [Croceitalea]|uniref:STAS/SEC14 domain-containing protein n=1 Tax=Croceitalea vernalis TaxID=3075599 RepID=A0ABU3BEI8_9FLAO|nr:MULTISPECIES: hypothetical protein [unclassified Croceitalea]MDT0538794.1 hypothetical protein [Croceitalea sp. P059]MDT0620577.1 hypothetical protein [Croceitalea sp. P007]